jgi:hypothetical protein
MPTKKVLTARVGRKEGKGDVILALYVIIIFIDLIVNGVGINTLRKMNVF